MQYATAVAELQSLLEEAAKAEHAQRKKDAAAEAVSPTTVTGTLSPPLRRGPTVPLSLAILCGRSQAESQRTDIRRGVCLKTVSFMQELMKIQQKRLALNEGFVNKMRDAENACASALKVVPAGHAHLIP
jgi:hypothetical protein